MRRRAGSLLAPVARLVRHSDDIWFELLQTLFQRDRVDPPDAGILAVPGARPRPIFSAR